MLPALVSQASSVIKNLNNIPTTSEGISYSNNYWVHELILVRQKLLLHHGLVHACLLLAMQVSISHQMTVHQSYQWEYSYSSKILKTIISHIHTFYHLQLYDKIAYRVVRRELAQMDYQDLGRRIRQHRTQKGWTQEGLAQRVSVSTSFVWHLERGSRKASLETIVSISNALSISMDYLLAGSLDTTVIGPVPNALTMHQAAVFKKIITVILDNLDKWI